MKSLGIFITVLIVVVFMSTYTVNQREKAILFALGEIKKENIGPGLHFKIPLLNNVRKFDSRVLTLDAQPQAFVTNEKKNVIVDYFVKWRIEEVAQFFRSTRGDENTALSRLSQIIEDGLRDEFGKRTIQEAVSGERAQIMDILQVRANQSAKEFGVQIVDVRVSRIDLPDEVSEAVYDRMRAERDRVAKDFRARGREEAEKIRANADRQRTVILANAYRDAEQIRGDGDAQSTALYARAFNRNKEFYAFLRSINAYKNTFSGKNDVIILQPDSEFFRYFNQSRGNK